ncbi:MAG: carboxypeptidase regulatory-like domain-containing protein [Acidobacteriota bacterium]
MAEKEKRGQSRHPAVVSSAARVSRPVAGALALSALLLVASACGGGEQPGGSAAGSAAPPTDTADGPGVISGMISFEGTPPRARPLSMESDPLCTPAPGTMSESLLVAADGSLQNVFVYVKDGLGSRTYPVATTAVRLDQQGCTYIPHVFGVQVGQTVMVSNSDSTLHNVHAMPKANREFNFGQPVKVPAAPRVFTTPEVMVPIRCDVHGWMNAYVGVLPHPFFAVTGANGAFELTGLPAGSFTIEAWHETLGTRTQQVTVDGQTPATVNLTFKMTA